MLSFLRSLDLVLAALVALLLCTGLVLVYSATWNEAGHLFAKQCVWAALGVAALFLTLWIDYRRLVEHAPRIYLASLALLLYVLFFGHTVYGSSRWIRIGAVGIQPSEIAKLAVILMLARVLTDRFGRITRFREILPALLVVAVPMALIVRQPDLGTAMVLAPLALAMLWMAGAPPRFLGRLLAAGLSALPLAWVLLHDYQRERVVAFLNPDYDPLAAGWTGIQVKIAVGSGELAGKGLLAGTQGQLQFVPQHHTDFIFAVLSEEWGFLGAMAVLFLYVLLILQAVKIGKSARDDTGVLLAAGIVALFTFQVLVNVGMTLGLLPITGIPLPFLSAGGSSMLKCMVAVGVLQNIHRHSRVT